MSAADRFRAAARDRDPARAAREFADDIRLYNPMGADPLVGRDAVAAALAGLDEVFDDFEHLQVLTDPDPGDAIAETQAVVFRARVGDHTVEGIDLLEVDHHDIATLADPEAADRLRIAISGPGAFRRFKEVLDRWPDQIRPWGTFADERRRGRVRAWLAGAGYTVAHAAPPRP